MIEKLQNERIEIASQMHLLFQSSYAVEAKILNAANFPPLNRPLESYQKNDTTFFAYREKTEIAGIIEITDNESITRINSLVVSPAFFRRGIARKLIEYVFDTFDSNSFIVETGVDNAPANELYKNLGFVEIKQWDTDFGIRKIRFEKRILD